MNAHVTTNVADSWTARAAQIGVDIAADGARCDAEDAFVAEGYARLKEAGFFKALVPVEFGGFGASQAEIADAIRVLAHSCGSTALAFSMHTHLVAVAAWRFKHQNAPTDGLLKRVAAENLILVSSGGSDWLKGAGVATKVDGGFRITARKVFSSGAPMGDLLMTSAVYEDPEAGATVLHFGVPLKAEGVSLEETWRTLGMRGTGSHDLVLDSVFVADAAISGRRPQGKWHPLFHIISQMAFPLIYAAYLGVAEGARDMAVAIARKKPDDGHIADLVGAMENALMGARLAHADMVVNAATRMFGPETTSRAMAGRTLVAQGVLRTVELAMEVAGGAAFYRKTGIERALRDIQGARYHPLQEGPQKRFSGRVALGWNIDG
jgi:acyl-CoA dehydrogenase